MRGEGKNVTHKVRAEGYAPANTHRVRWKRKKTKSAREREKRSKGTEKGKKEQKKPETRGSARKMLIGKP